MNTIQKFPEIKPNERFALVEDKGALKIFIVKKTKKNNLTALETLNKITKIIKEDKYQEDKYTVQWDVLKLMVKTVVNKYSDKFERVSALSKAIHGVEYIAVKNKEAELQKLLKMAIRKQNKASPPKFFPQLPYELVHEICSHLSRKNQKMLCVVNKNAKICLNHFFLKEAYKLNFRGKEVSYLAREYLNHIPSLIRDLNKGGFISKDHAVFKRNKTIDVEATLKNIKNLNLHPNEFLITDWEGSTALHAILDDMHNFYSDSVALQIVLDWGINPNLRDADGNTPLHLAWYSRVISMLLKAGADINASNNEGLSPLCMAISERGCSRFLLQKGADANYQNPLNGNTLFHYAVKSYCQNSYSPSEMLDLMHLLHQYCAEGLENKVNHAHKTPLQLLEIVKHNEEQYHNLNFIFKVFF